jgi:GT2 family glycosyltransferase
MINKFKKYVSYIGKFVKSPKKAENLSILFEEIKEKGLVTGIRSVLHIKSGATEDSAGWTYDWKEFSVEYDRSVTIVLPLNTEPLVSVIIPTYGQLDFTYNCIRSIYEDKTFTDYEIIVADDHSPDDLSLLTEKFENLRLIRQTENLGFLRNCNAATRHAKGKYIVFLNNDTRVTENWAIELLNVFNRFPKAGIVGSMLLYPDGKLQEAGGVIWQNGSAINYGHRDNAGKPEYNYVKQVDYVSGASLMIRRDLWEDIGGFDERYIPAYCEDSDLCFEVREKGYEVWYQPFSRVIHYEGVSHGTDLKSGVKQYQVVNTEKFGKKWQHVLQHKAPNIKSIFTERERSGGKKHILILDHNVPTVDKDAGSRTINNFVDCLLELGYNVKFLVPNMYPEYNYTKLLQEKGVEVLHGDAYVFFHHEWESFFAANMNKFDAILLSRSSICIPYLKYLNNHKYKGKTIYYGHDLGYLRLEEEIEREGKTELKTLAKKTRADEDFMYSNVDHALMISYDEIKYLEKSTKTPLHYIPPYFFDIAPETAGYKERKGILFVGGFHHPPNQDAMKWFMSEVYPSIQTAGIELTIVGSEMPEFVLNYGKQFDSVTVRPDVSIKELEELYSAARIAVVPLTSGAGVKGKVIEAMAKGVPLVGTSKAFEGLNKSGTFLYQDLDRADMFAAEVVKLYNDKAYWEQLSAFGKSYVQQYFNRQTMKNTLEKIINS